MGKCVTSTEQQLAYRLQHFRDLRSEYIVVNQRILLQSTNRCH